MDIEDEVAYQQLVVDALDKALIPNAKDPLLKALLRRVRPILVTQLARTKASRKLTHKSTR